MNIKTREPNPNKNGEVEAPIALIDKSTQSLTRLSSVGITKRRLCIYTFILLLLPI
jgi:ribonuclease G